MDSFCSFSLCKIRISKLRNKMYEFYFAICINYSYSISANCNLFVLGLISGKKYFAILNTHLQWGTNIHAIHRFFIGNTKYAYINKGFLHHLLDIINLRRLGIDSIQLTINCILKFLYSFKSYLTHSS